MAFIFVGILKRVEKRQTAALCYNVHDLQAPFQIGWATGGGVYQRFDVIFEINDIIEYIKPEIDCELVFFLYLPSLIASRFSVCFLAFPLFTGKQKTEGSC